MFDGIKNLLAQLNFEFKIICITKPRVNQIQINNLSMWRTY